MTCPICHQPAKRKGKRVYKTCGKPSCIKAMRDRGKAGRSASMARLLKGPARVNDNTYVVMQPVVRSRD